MLKDANPKSFHAIYVVCGFTDLRYGMDRPKDLFRNSIATPSLVAAIIHGKYTNHPPLDRQSRCYKDNGIKLETNTMANWMINAADLYLSTIYDELHKELIRRPILYADDLMTGRFTLLSFAEKDPSPFWVSR